MAIIVQAVMTHGILLIGIENAAAYGVETSRMDQV